MLKTHKLTVTALAMTIGALLPAAAFAGTETSGKEAKNVVEEAQKSCISGDLGVNFVTKYFSRGIDLEDQGVIGQPYADIYFKVYDGGDSAFINSITLNASVWFSLQSHRPFASAHNTLAAWYEFDYTPGIAVTFLKNFTLATNYYEFDSPDGSFNAARSINATLSYNDSDLLGMWALHPHITVLKELPGGGNPEGFAGLGPDGWYFEPGIAPSFTLVKDGMFPTTLTLPIMAGFGAQHFYAGDGFGYFSAGANVSVGLGFMPKCLGTWTYNVGATYYYLHEHLAIVDNGHHNDWVGQTGVAVAF